MQKFYLQVEAVNLGQMVFDTHDISTIRGGSFLLLDAMRKLSEEPKFQGRIEKITTAASQGLFSTAIADNESVDKLETLSKEVIGFLVNETGGHGTFAAAYEPEQDDFRIVLERLQAKIRRKQWLMPTVAVPQFAPTEQECYLDGWRPGTKIYGVSERAEGAKISEATWFRREHGRDLKHRLFERILGEEPFTDNLTVKDLGALAENPKKGVLNNKIAYIHVDGNSFGRVRRAVCTSAETRAGFDEQIQEACREPFLRDLLHMIDDDADFLAKDSEGRLARRLELLMWGGDEFAVVAPAWRGFQVLDLFYKHAQTLMFEGVHLSHRAAIVFCHHDTPILQVRRIAEDLLGRAKESITCRLEQIESVDEFVDMTLGDRDEATKRVATHQYGNAIQYLALESFDMLRGSLSGFLNDYYKNVSYENLLLYAHNLAPLLNDLQLIRENVARGQILKMIDALKGQDNAEAEKVQERILAVLPGPKAGQVRSAIDSVLDGQPDRWYWVADLWDYLEEWSA